MKQKTIEVIDALRRDGRYALRRLRRDWQFSAGAIAILALGIGANTAVFSLLNSTLFQPHPFADSERLVNIYQNEAKSGEPEGVSYPAFLDLERENPVFAEVGASVMDVSRYQTEDAAGGRGSLRSGVVEYVSANYLGLLGMRPSLGRWFTAAEQRSSEPVVVLGWAAWQRQFGGSPDVLGQTLIVGGKPVQVIGVGPKTLNSSQNNFVVTSLWLPLRSGTPGVAQSRLDNRRDLFLYVRGRLRDGVTFGQAQAAMDVAARRLAEDYPDTDPKQGITLLFTDEVHIHPRERFLKPVAFIVLSVVGLVLAIACSNLATLLLVRSSARSTEVSVRLALGATRQDLVRHLLLDALLLAFAGAAVGVAIAHAALRYFTTIDLPVIVSVAPDYHVLGFAVGVATLCAIGFGLTPALKTTRIDVAGALRESKGSSRGSLSLAAGSFTLKNVLVTGQVAASFLLLAGAALAMSVLTATLNRGVGYRPEGLAIVGTDPAFAGYDQDRARAALEELKRHTSGLPGVISAFVTTGLPVEGQFDTQVRFASERDGESFEVEGRWAGTDYFHTLGIPILFGRTFEERDSMESPGVVVVSEAFARRFFGTPNAVGKRLYFTDAGAKPAEIVGVVGNVRSIDMVAVAPERFIYRSDAQLGVMPTTIVVRTSGSEVETVNVLQREVRRLRPELPVIHALTMKQRQAEELLLFRVAAVALSVLGGLGLLLVCVGLYAVVSYAAAQRSSELGIRIALGARPGDLTWLVVRDVTVLVGTGIAIGAGLSWSGVAMVEASGTRIAGLNPIALLAAALLIVACGVAAAWVPVRRVLLTDPIAAIRHT